jgi:hypothetical protein
MLKILFIVNRFHVIRVQTINAPPGNRTRVARMGILHDTTTPAAPCILEVITDFVAIQNGTQT